MAEPLKLSRRYTYDAENQITSVTYEDGVVISYTYDKAGNRISVTRSDSAGPAAPGISAGQAEQRPQTTPSPVPAAELQCGNCGIPVRPGKKFCSNCGYKLSVPSQTTPATPPIPALSSACPGCGNRNRPGAKFCGTCGKKLS